MPHNNRFRWNDGPTRPHGQNGTQSLYPHIDDRLYTAVMKDTPEEHIDRSWKQPKHTGASVAAVSEARRLHKQHMSIEGISEVLDGHGVKHTRLQLEKWLNGVTAIKGFPIVHANDEPYLITSPETFAMNKRIALLKRMLDEAGLTLLEFKDKHDGRITCVASAGTEETRIFSINQKEGDRRADLNEASRMRQFARECGTPTTQLAAKLKPVVEEFKKVAKVAPPPSAILGWSEGKPEPTQDPYLEGITKRWVAAPVQSEPKTMTNETKPKAKGGVVGTKITRLTMNEQYRLIEFLKTLDVTKFKSTLEVNKAASEFLKLNVNIVTLRKAMDVAGIKIKVKREPNKNAHVRVAPILARNLLRVMEQLGIKPDAELEELAK